MTMRTERQRQLDEVARRCRVRLVKDPDRPFTAVQAPCGVTERYLIVHDGYWMGGDGGIGFTDGDDRIREWDDWGGLNGEVIGVDAVCEQLQLLLDAIGDENRDEENRYHGELGYAV